MSAYINNSENLIGWSRRSMWTGLFLVLLVAVAAILIAIGGEAAASGTAMFKVLPVCIAIGALSLRRAKPASRRDLAALEADELRQHASAQSFKYAYAAMLAAQPALALVTFMIAVEYPVVLMAVATIATGLLVSMGTILWLDR